MHYGRHQQLRKRAVEVETQTLPPRRFPMKIAALAMLLWSAPLGAQEWSAHRVLRIGSEEGFTLPRVASVAPAADGSFFVLETETSQVYHISRDGKLLHKFGRRGSDPGAISQAPRLVAAIGENVAVVDPLNTRVS